MKVRIYKPARTAMQSGHGKAKDWILEYDEDIARGPEALMGWTSSNSTLGQVRLHFDTSEEAVVFAEKKGWTYSLAKERVRRVKPRNYGDNFKYYPPEEHNA